jgi:hypothetical protein
MVLDAGWRPNILGFNSPGAHKAKENLAGERRETHTMRAISLAPNGPQGKGYGNSSLGLLCPVAIIDRRDSQAIE